MSTAEVRTEWALLARWPDGTEDQWPCPEDLLDYRTRYYESTGLTVTRLRRTITVSGWVTVEDEVS